MSTRVHGLQIIDQGIAESFVVSLVNHVDHTVWTCTPKIQDSGMGGEFPKYPIQIISDLKTPPYGP
jgi:hypothetical protein